MARWPDYSKAYFNSWTYVNGYVLYGFEMLYRSTGDKRYFDYAKRYIDHFIDANGTFHGVANTRGQTREIAFDNLDNMMTGNTVVMLYEQTKDQRYMKAATTIRRALDDYPRNNDGVGVQASYDRYINYKKSINAKEAVGGFLWATAIVERPELEKSASPQGRLAPRPLYRDPPFDAPTDPVLCFNAEQNKWFMYYTARRATAEDTPGVTWVHGSNIGMAESSDGGATWTYRGTADISYGKDAHPNDYTYWAPEVIWHNGLYHMFLSYVPGIFTDWNHPREIVHLTSKDGVKWDTVGPVDLQSDRVIDACVIQLADGTWRMWYKDETQAATPVLCGQP